MTVSTGTKLGSYEVLAPIGKGGMGEVWKARDTKLGRDVALKILPAAFASDPDRMARFEREARVLASLDHPNIAAIYGLEERDGVRALVLALVDGPTLADKIAAGPIPLEEAIQIARQIAEAVEYAHDRGVIHRDLKPVNIKITSGGMVKVLDFGLAKALDDEPVAGSGTNSPTLTIGATRAGVLLGTAAYMSPEQAKGKQAGRRSDIWSFGAVLYEMVTGKPPFSGESVGDILASVIKDEPKLDGVPRELRGLVARCLNKDLRQRLQAIGEARITLENPAPPAQITPATAQLNRSWRWIVTAAVLVIALGILSFLYFRQTPPIERPLRYTIPAPENATIHSFALSPDGRYVAIAAAVNGKRQLWLRALDALQTQLMPGTDDATYPFWSPDSRYIGFFARGRLKKVAASGGPPQSLCDAPDGRGGSWNRTDVIVFSPNGSAGDAIQRVAAAGGAPANVTGSKGVYFHPAFLPDGDHFLYLLTGVSAEQNGVYLSSLDGKENQRVLADTSSVVPAAGHLLFIRDNNLMAQPFDVARAQTMGDVLPVAEGVSLSGANDYAPMTASETGVLLYESGAGNTANQIAWYDRGGKLLGTVGGPSAVWEPAISPNEKLLAFRRQTDSGADLWLRDLARGVEQRFTTDGAGFNNGPFWSPTGDRVVFRSTRDSNGNLYLKAATGTGQDDLLLANRNNKVPTQWSADGRFIVYSELDPKTKWDLWVLPMDSGTERKSVPFLRSDFSELFGQLSPDSHWMAYTSDASGQREVYVRPFPAGDGQWRISIAGGEQPRWRGDGKELFFVGADGKMMAVAVKAIAGERPIFEAGPPQPLFEAHLAQSYNGSLFEYDVTEDGKRFLVDTTGSGSASESQLNVIVNWTAALKK